MRILIVCARFPERGHKGDQLRVREQVGLLSVTHEITVVTAGLPSSAAAQRELECQATVRIVAPHPLARGISALAGAVRMRPFQTGWMMPRQVWNEATQAAERSDVVLASTIRCLPRPLPAPTVLDHIDALSVNMRQRAELEQNPVMRLGARIEARLLAAHEARAAGWVAAQTVISCTDALALPHRPLPVIIPASWEPSPEGEAPERDIDVIVTGNMRYPPNRDAARWLASEIAPRLRRRRPDARVVVAGRSAGELALHGVEVHGDVPDLAELLQRARVAAVPLRSGTGVPVKLLEAIANGAAVVCTPWVARATELDVDTAESADAFAVAIERLLANEGLRRKRLAATRAGLEGRRPAAVRRMLERVLVNAARTQA